MFVFTSMQVIILVLLALVFALGGAFGLSLWFNDLRSKGNERLLMSLTANVKSAAYGMWRGTEYAAFHDDWPHHGWILCRIDRYPNHVIDFKPLTDKKQRLDHFLSEMKRIGVPTGLKWEQYDHIRPDDPRRGVALFN